MKTNHPEIELRFSELENLILYRVAQVNSINNSTLPKTSTLFQDVHGKNLFQYAIQLERLDKLSSLIDRLKIDIANKLVTDLEVKKMLYQSFKKALITDNLAIVSFLYHLQLPSTELATDTIKLELRPNLMSVCKENCRSFLNAIFQEKFQTLCIEARSAGTPFSREVLLYAIMCGNKKFIVDSDLSFLSKNKHLLLLSSLIKAAVKVNNIDIIDYLVKKNTDCIYDNNLLHLALTHGSHQTITYLLDNFSLQLINEVDSTGNSPLVHAIRHNAPTEIIKTLLAKKPNLHLVTVECNTLFHQVARFGSPTILQLIATDLGKEDSLKLMLQKNIYNQNALDIAYQYQKHDNCNFFEKTCNFNQRNNASFVDNPHVICQLKILKKMSYYLALTHQNPEFFIEGGHCNGFGFLYLYYNALGKRDYFFYIMSELANWDGSAESLKHPLITYSFMPYEKQLYTNLGELFEQWINDAIWFQQSSEAFKDIIAVAQWNRNKQLEDAQKHKDSNYLECNPMFRSFPIKNLQIFQLIELLHLSAFLPKGTCIELNGLVDNKQVGHLVVLTVELNGFSFYDSNRPFIANSILTLEQVTHLLNGLSLYKSASYGYLSYQLSLTGTPPSQPSLSDFYQLIKSEKMKLDPKFRTVENNYTLTHIAVLTCNYSALSLLLDNNHSIWISDFHGETAWSLALKNNNLLALALMTYAELQQKNPNMRIFQDVLSTEELLTLLKKDTNILDTLLKKLIDYISLPTTRFESIKVKEARIGTLVNQIKVGLLTTYPFEAYFPILKQLSDTQLLIFLDQPFYGEDNLLIHMVKIEQYFHVKTILDHLSPSIGHLLMSKGWFLGRPTVFNLLSEDLTLENFKKLTLCYPEKSLPLLLNGPKPNASTFVEFFAEKKQVKAILSILNFFSANDVDIYLANNGEILKMIEEDKVNRKAESTENNSILTFFSAMPSRTCKLAIELDKPLNSTQF